MKKSKIAFVLALIIFTQCTKKVEISQWRGPNRDGIYPEKNLLKEWPENGPELLWKYDELGCGYASAAVLSDKVITIATIDSTSFVIAFDHDGNVIYNKELGPEWVANFPGMNSSPLIYGDLGYVLGGLGDLYCFNQKTGDIVWTKNLFTDFDGKNNSFGVTENFLIDGEKLFVTPGGQKHNMIALNRITGELIWSNPGNGELNAYGCPNIIHVGEKQYLINYTVSSLFSLDPNTGETLWRFPLEIETSRANTPLYINGYLYALAGYKSGFIKLKISDDGKSVEEVWRNKVFDDGMGDVIYLNNTFYAGSPYKYKFLGAIDPNTGEAIDSLKMNTSLTLIAADNMIYAYNFRGQFSLVKPDENGMKLVSSFEVKGGKENQHCSHPVIHNGRLYIRHDNSLFVYNIAKEVS